MPNLPDAKKRVKQNDRNRSRNRSRKSAVKSQTRKLLDKLGAGDLDGAKAEFVQVTKRLDQVAATSTMHKNTAARKKSRLAKRLNKAAAKT